MPEFIWSPHAALEPKNETLYFEARNGIMSLTWMKPSSSSRPPRISLRRLPATDNAPFVGCKKQAQETIRELAPQSHSFYVTERWLGGTLTNLTTIRKSISRMKFIDDLESNGGMPRCPNRKLLLAPRKCQITPQFDWYQRHG